MEIPADNALADVTVWYDGDCPLCIREINLMRRLDKRRAINFVEIQTAMWRAIPMLRPLGVLAKSRPVLWVLERLYIGFLRVRPWMQRRIRRMDKRVVGS